MVVAIILLAAFFIFFGRRWPVARDVAALLICVINIFIAAYRQDFVWMIFWTMALFAVITEPVWVPVVKEKLRGKKNSK